MIATNAPDCPSDDSDGQNHHRTPKGIQKPLKSKRRRITKHDIKQIAGLVVKYRMNETEACLEAGIAPKTWANFKLRHKTQEAFEEMINGIRAAQLHNCIDSIDASGNDREFETVTKSGQITTVTKPGDWRAKAWIAERVLAADRFGQQQAPAPVAIDAYAQLGLDVAKLLGQAYAQHQQAKAVVDVQEVKQLPEQSNDK